MKRGSKGRYEKVPPSLLACHELPRHGLSSSLFRSPSAARSRQWPCGMMPFMAEHSGRGGVILDAAGEPVQRDRRHPEQDMIVSPFSVPLEVDLKRTETFREGKGQGAVSCIRQPHFGFFCLLFHRRGDHRGRCFRHEEEDIGAGILSLLDGFGKRFGRGGKGPGIP